MENACRCLLGTKTRLVTESLVAILGCYVQRSGVCAEDTPGTRKIPLFIFDVLKIYTSDVANRSYPGHRLVFNS